MSACRCRKIFLGLLLLFIGGAVGIYYLPLRQLALLTAPSRNALLALDEADGVLAWRVGADDCWRLPTTLPEISPDLINATIAAEDQRFFTHSGLDFLALARALWQNLTHARRISGASTLTMQTARLLSPRARTYSAKICEIYAAFCFEREHDKQKILTAYFNHAPYGGNLVGVNAAARRYFNKPPSALTLGEAALLAGLPQSPTRFNPRKNLNAALQRREWVFARMLALNLVTPAQLEKARTEKIIIQPAAISSKNNLRGFADWLLQIYPAGGVLRTTINPNLQTLAQQTAAATELSILGIDGLAIVVIDVEKSALVAMVTNHAPENPQSGQINGALIWRQPGSLLKPFLFARAYQQGKITPRDLVDDDAATWREYRPENMDKTFSGKIAAEDALARSRNLPAVKLLADLGVEKFRDVLAQLNLPVKISDDVGLSLALGTPEMRLLDLTNAYAALARWGKFQPLNLLAGKNNAADAVAVFSPAAAWLTLRSLSTEKVAPRVAWKTGTSWRHRDAWAIMMTPRYVVGVWCGGWRGDGNDRLIGAETALPIAGALMKNLGIDRGGDVWEKPRTVQTRRRCAASGLVAGNFCGTTTEDDYIVGVGNEKICALCAVTPTVNAITATTAPKTPSLNLISPRANAEYLLTDAMKTLPLQASSGEVTWFLNDAKIAVTADAEVYLWQMQRGTHTLLAVDNATGKAQKICFTVKILE